MYIICPYILIYQYWYRLPRCGHTSPRHGLGSIWNADQLSKLLHETPRHTLTHSLVNFEDFLYKICIARRDGMEVGCRRIGGVREWGCERNLVTMDYNEIRFFWRNWEKLRETTDRNWEKLEEIDLMRSNEIWQWNRMENEISKQLTAIKRNYSGW